ncbi:hypothetical protein PIROE2DRAFT_8827 [Piromyces sp. E2]|nr:hypothetical protein PIROE2DRAFT_8827 [Piromyces sp. E2]|eukprot:OUM64437.1 hypothetical protein PIROE2DRAFT_8827 [Piromyces sp. E2]
MYEFNIPIRPLESIIVLGDSHEKYFKNFKYFNSVTKSINFNIIPIRIHQNPMCESLGTTFTARAISYYHTYILQQFLQRHQLYIRNEFLLTIKTHESTEDNTLIY